VVIGTPIANRTRVEWEELIGFFANTLALRAAGAGADVSRSFCSRCGRPRWERTRTRTLPFEKLVDELRPETGRGAHAAVPGDVRAADAPMPELALPAIAASRVEVEVDAASMDLALD